MRENMIIFDLEDKQIGVIRADWSYDKHKIASEREIDEYNSQITYDPGTIRVDTIGYNKAGIIEDLDIGPLILIFLLFFAIFMLFDKCRNSKRSKKNETTQDAIYDINFRHDC